MSQSKMVMRETGVKEGRKGRNERKGGRKEGRKGGRNERKE